MHRHEQEIVLSYTNHVLSSLETFETYLSIDIDTILHK